MICSWFESEFLEFLRRSANVMGCLFGCFRFKDDGVHRSQPHLLSQPLPPNSTEPVVAQKRNRLSSLLLSEVEEKDRLPSKNKDNGDLGMPEREVDVLELKDEAMFLKACGTLPETPAEIRHASERLKDSALPDVDSEPSEFHSWLPNNSIQLLNLENQLDQPPTPIRLCEEWVKGSGSSLQTPSSTTNEQNTGRLPICSTEGSMVGNVGMGIKVYSDQTPESGTSSNTSRPLASSVQCRNKNVRFDTETDVASFSSKSSSSEIASHNSKQSDSAGNYSESKKPSPYPTPLQLTNEMQTPGTVFPAYLDNMARKNLRIRSQYVYSVLNPVENLSQWEVLKEEDSASNQMSSELRESLEQADKVSPRSEVRMRETSVEREFKVEPSLSSWLKPLPTNLEGNIQQLCPMTSEKAHRGRTPGDRPILGMVAAHWNEDEPSRISPKWWAGNGIPNSTTKYKEDQKVSWHATPFEERLEKALSEETFISQRKRISGTPHMDFPEHDDSDTASSQLPSSTHFKSMVSF